MLNSTSKGTISAYTPNTSFSNQQPVLSTSNRPRSSMSKRRKSRKSLTPLDPKLYRIAHSGFNHNKPPIKKKKKKRLVPFSSSSTQAHSHHEQTTTPKGKSIEKIKTAPKFISMKTFDIVKRSWTRKDDSTPKNEPGLIQIGEAKKKKKKKKTKSNSQNREFIRPKPHFSEVFGKSKRKAKSESQQKDIKPKLKQGKEKALNMSFIKQSHDKGHNSKGRHGIARDNSGSSSASLPQIVLPGNAQHNSIAKAKEESSLLIKSAERNRNQSNGPRKKNISTPHKFSPTPSPSNGDNKIRKQNSNEKEKEKDVSTVRAINNSFTFGKEPNNPKPHDYNKVTINQSMNQGKFPMLSNKSIVNTYSSSTFKATNKTQFQTNKAMPQVIQFNNPPEKKGEKNTKENNMLNLSPNFSSNSANIVKQNTSADKYKQNDLQEISNVNKININSVIANNLILNEEIQKSMKELIDNSQCVYCLKRVNHPIALTCSHEVCRNCGDEIVSLSKFAKVAQNESQLTLKCPKCKVKTKIASACLDELERSNWHPIELSEGQNALEKVQICEICPSSKYIRDIAEFECLNCDILLCYECRIRHLSNIRHQSHKIIQYHKIVQEKVELTLCDYHHEPLKLYCLTDSKAICVICANYEANHKAHSIKTIKNVIDDQSFLLASAIREKESQIRLIEELINQLSYAVGKLEEEKASFTEKMNKVYEELYEAIKQHETKLKKEVSDIFEGKLRSLNTKLKNFNYIKTRYEYYRNLICEKDIDIIDRVALVAKLNHKIDKVDQLAYFKVRNYNKSLADSQLMNKPIKDIDKSMSLFKFLPITDVNISILSSLFSSSNIIKKDMILTDLVLLLPKIKSGLLLYQISKDGASTKLFHDKCDNKGPTITFVKTEDGNVFGGFNPMSWISESMYNETEESYLFKLGYGTNAKGLKCPVKKYMKHHAIKQNGEGYSPGFGEVDSADLFISYKNLKNSYSNLGKVYKAPKGFDPSCFLAGRSNNWDIVEVEVYAVEVMNDEEYNKIVLS